MESEDDEEMMPEEANLAKASKELGVAEVVGVVQDHWAHLVEKTIILIAGMMMMHHDDRVCEKIYVLEWW